MKELLITVVIVVLFTSFVMVVNPPETGEEMDIAEKLSSNTPLDAQETQRLKLALQNIDTLNSWIGSDGQPNLASMNCRVPEFEVIPLGFYAVARTNVQSVPNNTATNVVFEYVTKYKNNQYLLWDGDERVTALVSHRYNFSGRADFAAGAVGERKVFVTVYDAGGTQLYYADLATMPATAAGNAILSYNFSYELSKGQYVKFGVLQNSGGALNVMFHLAAIAVV